MTYGFQLAAADMDYLLFMRLTIFKIQVAICYDLFPFLLL